MTPDPELRRRAEQWVEEATNGKIGWHGLPAIPIDLMRDLLALVAEQAQQIEALSVLVDGMPEPRRLLNRAGREQFDRAERAEAALLAALLREGRALQASTAGDKTNENADTRVDDSQYGAPLATAAENKPVPTKDAAWAVRNCHMLARRELKRLASWRKNGGETTPVGMVETAWEHIQRICELTGYVGDGPLRESSSVSPHPARHEP